MNSKDIGFTFKFFVELLNSYQVWIAKANSMQGGVW